MTWSLASIPNLVPKCLLHEANKVFRVEGITIIVEKNLSESLDQNFKASKFGLIFM